MIAQSKDRKKVSSGIKKNHRKKRLYDKGSRPMLTKVGKHKVKNTRIRSGDSRLRLLRTDIANVYDPKEKKFKKATIKTVASNPSNRHYARANIITKGAEIDTDLGKAKITNRPGQEGVINATLV